MSPGPAAVQSRRASDPAARSGNKKLELVLDVLKSAYDGSTDLAKAIITWDKLVAVVVPIDREDRRSANALGLFQNPLNPTTHNDLQLVTWPVERLTPYARNARTHSVRTFGPDRGLDMLSSTGPTPSLSGRRDHQRRPRTPARAARKRGKTEVPVIVHSHADRTNGARLFSPTTVLALNAGWYDEMPARRTRGHPGGRFDLERDRLFPMKKLADLLHAPEDGQAGNTDEDAVPVNRRMRSRPSAMSGLLAQHRLLCGDSTQIRIRGEGARGRSRRYGFHRSSVQT